MQPLNKVYAYITRQEQLLVFRHIDFPEAGIQVPGGTMEAHEEAHMAVLREAYEETGLEGLRLLSYLGKYEWRSSAAGHQEIHYRHFYHLSCGKNVPETWRHYEHHPSNGSPAPILFEFCWLPLLEAENILNPYYVAGLEVLRTEIDRSIVQNLLEPPSTAAERPPEA